MFTDYLQIPFQIVISLKYSLWLLVTISVFDFFSSHLK